MIKAIFFLSIISYWNVIGGPPPIISKLTFTEEELVIDGSQLEDTKSVSIRTLENKILKDYEVDNGNPEKIVARPMGGSFEPGDKNLYLVITDSEGELFYPITLRSKTSDRAVYKITPKENAKIPNKIVVDENSEINFSPGDNSGRYFYNYSIYANQAGDLAIKNEDKDLFKIDQEGNLEIAGTLKVKGKTLKFFNTLNFENQLFSFLPPNQREGDFRVKDVVIGEDNNISGVVDFSSSGDMDVATATFHVESSTGRVGIGNATPTYKLDVSGATNSGIRLKQAAASTNTSGAFFNGMVFEELGGKSFGIGYGAGDLFSINSYDGTYRNIFSLNNVGNGVISGSLKIGAYTLPSTDGTSGQVLSTNGAGVASWTSGGAGLGDVVGPASSTVDHLASFSSGTGKAIKDSGINSADLPIMVVPAASSSTIILSGGADKTLTTTGYTVPATIGSPTYVLKSDGTNAVWEQDYPGTQSQIGTTRVNVTGLLPMFLSSDGNIITDSDVEAINVPELSLNPTAANQIIISTGNGKYLTTTIYPISPTIGATGTVLKSDGSGASWQPEVSVANFTAGPATSTQFGLARYEDSSGKKLKDSPVVMDDVGNFNFLRAVSTTEASHPCPSMTESQRDAFTVVSLIGMEDGDCIFNTDSMETNFRRMGRWGALPVREPWVSGYDYKKADLIHSDPYTIFAAKNFTAGATINDDYYAGNFNFPSILPVTTCTSQGGDVTFSGSNIDVTGGKGLIITKSTSGHSWPDENRVKWNITNAIPPVSPTSWNTVYVGKDGVVKVTSGRPDSAVLRTEIVLATFNPSLSQIIDHRGSCFDPGNTIRILNYILGKLIKGFEYFPNAGLTMGRNPGEIYGTGINFDGDIPNVLSYPAQPTSPITYYFTRNSRVGGEQNNVDPHQYDPNTGTLTNVPNGRWTYQRVYLVFGGTTAIQYGQKFYTTLNAAISGVTHDALLFVENPNLSENAKWIATIVMKEGTTALNNTLENALLNCGIFGCSEGVGGGTAAGGGGGGDVFGPTSSVANNLATFSDVTGKLIEDSGINKANLTTMTTGALGANQIIISAGGKELSSTIYQIPLAIGSTGTVLKSDGTNAFWQADTDTNSITVVEDILTSTSAVNALSANQGRLLDNKITPLTSSSHTHTNKTTLDVIKNNGTATEFLAGDGTYKIPVDTNTVTTIVDNLTSTSATSALSANQGKVLNDKITPLPTMAANGGAGMLVQTVAADKALSSSGLLTANIPTMTAVGGAGMLVQTVAADKVLSSSGVAITNLATMAANGVAGNLVQTAAGDKALSNSTIPVANVVTKSSNFSANNRVLISVNASRSATETAYTIPATDGSPNFVLKTNGSGVVTWQADTDTAFAPTSTDKTTAYTIANSDCQNTLTFTHNTTPATFTVPNTLPVGCQINIVQMGAAQVTFVGSGGLNVINGLSMLKTRTQYSPVTLLIVNPINGILGGDVGN